MVMASEAEKQRRREAQEALEDVRFDNGEGAILDEGPPTSRFAIEMCGQQIIVSSSDRKDAVMRAFDAVPESMVYEADTFTISVTKLQ